MKKITEEEVFEWLRNENCTEEGGTDQDDTRIIYYLNVTEKGELISSYYDADQTFTSYIDWKEYGVDWETWTSVWTTFDIHDYMYEDWTFEPFAAVVEDLTNQANKWLEKAEQGKAGN